MIAIVQFFISLVTILVFCIISSRRMFGDQVVGRVRKYLVSQTFTASYPELDRKSRFTPVMLRVPILGCKLAKSYFFLTLSFKGPIRALVGMCIQNCNDAWFGGALCQYQTNQ